MKRALEVPAHLDRSQWVGRWDRMQECYLVDRRERLALLAWLVRVTQPAPCVVLDLGCGTGSVMATVLEAMPEAHAVGIDLDERLLILAEHRLEGFGRRARLVCRDIRDPAAFGDLESVDAVLSATSLHWLAAEELAELYGRIAALLAPGGLFANADHVGSTHAALQDGWEARRRGELEPVQRRQAASDSPWEGFWQEYSRALGMENADGYRRAVCGAWRGVEQGLPLAWHLDALRTAGLSSVECFWRRDCDAIYGGFR